MKYFIYIILFLGTAFFFADPGIGEAEENSGPKIVIEEQYYDAKEVKQGDTIRHTFKVKNEGDQTLEIRQVKPG